MNSLGWDIVGSLRAINFITLVAQHSSSGFPLDDSIRNTLRIRRVDFEELLALSIDVCQGVDCYRDFRSAIDDLLNDSELLTQDVVTLWLSLYGGEHGMKQFDLSDPEILYPQLRTILIRQLEVQWDAVFCARVFYYETYSEAVLRPDPTGRIIRFMEVISSLLPPELMPFTALELASRVADSWLNSDAVKNYARTTEVGQNALRRVVTELRTTLSGANTNT